MSKKNQPQSYWPDGCPLSIVKPKANSSFVHFAGQGRCGQEEKQKRPTYVRESCEENKNDSIS
jgi:hypothetical protein